MMGPRRPPLGHAAAADSAPTGYQGTARPYPAHIERPEDVRTRWVFAYGSLIWNPEIPVRRAEPARIHGFHRAFCIRSTRYRGTPDQPGLVLGLDRGGACVGIAYELDESDHRSALQTVFDREIPVRNQRVYQARVLTARLKAGEAIEALAFVADHQSPWYCRLDDRAVLAILRASAGVRGANRDYVLNTWHALEARGVRDRTLERFARMLLTGLTA